MGNPESKDENKTTSELGASNITYTQVIKHSLGGPLIGNKHGGNHDSVSTCIISPNFAVTSVADGAGLVFWGEVAAKLATKFFVEIYQEIYSTKYSKELPSIEELKADLKTAFVRVNQKLCSYKDTKSSLEIFDLGGQCTLVGAILFKVPMKGKQFDKKYRGKWISVVLGSGDSPCLRFSPNANPQWEFLFKDKGDMMPFYGMREDMLIEPAVTEISEGESIVVFSDGILVNYPNLEMNVPKEYSLNAQSLANYVMETSYKTHIDKQSDPDDVTIGVLTLETKKDNSEKKFPHLVETVELTTKFFPSFAITVDLPWGSYSFPSS